MRTHRHKTFKRRQAKWPPHYLATASLSSSTHSLSVELWVTTKCTTSSPFQRWCMQFNAGRKWCVNTAVGWLRQYNSWVSSPNFKQHFICLQMFPESNSELSEQSAVLRKEDVLQLWRSPDFASGQPESSIDDIKWFHKWYRLPCDPLQIHHCWNT